MTVLENEIVKCCMNFQAVTLKRYPAQLSLTTWMSLVGGAQSAVFSAIVAHEPKEWIVGFNIDIWSILYSVSRDFSR